MSLVFYGFAISNIPYALICVSIITYGGALWIAHARKNTSSTPPPNEKAITALKWAISAMCVATLIIGPTTGWFELLGNSYFTLKALSYLIDVSRDEKNCEKNYLFYLLYLVYLPTILQGPFNRFAQFRESLSQINTFDYTRVMHGAQRFLWGAFKKLVIVVRLQQLGTFVVEDWSLQSGLSICLIVISYSFWFYVDFSSYMDIMSGVSETFAIKLPENFRQPYFSKSIAEFWRRWHITLGAWFKDYIMVPFIQSKPGRKLRKNFKKFGNEIGKLAPILVGTFLVWICTAFWHGIGWKYFIWGMYYCIIICISLIVEPTTNKIKSKLGIDEKSKEYSMFCMVRTWMLLFVANLILIVSNLSEFKTIFKQLIGSSFLIGGNISLASLEWSAQSAIVLIIGLGLLLCVSILKEKNIDILGYIDRRTLALRWAVYYSLIFAVLFFGIYGEANTGEFIYMQF